MLPPKTSCTETQSSSSDDLITMKLPSVLSKSSPGVVQIVRDTQELLEGMKRTLQTQTKELQVAKLERDVLEDEELSSKSHVQSPHDQLEQLECRVQEQDKPMIILMKDRARDKSRVQRKLRNSSAQPHIEDTSIDSECNETASVISSSFSSVSHASSRSSTSWESTRWKIRSRSASAVSQRCVVREPVLSYDTISQSNWPEPPQFADVDGQGSVHALQSQNRALWTRVQELEGGIEDSLALLA